MYRILEWVILLYLIQYQPYKYHCLGLWRAYRKNGSTLHLATHHWDVGPFEPRLQYSEEPDISDNFHLSNLLLELRNTWVYYIFDLELFLIFWVYLKNFLTELFLKFTHYLALLLLFLKFPLIMIWGVLPLGDLPGVFIYSLLICLTFVIITLWAPIFRSSQANVTSQKSF